MADSQKHVRNRSTLFELLGWTFILALALWELARRDVAFGAWCQTGVAAMGIVKAGWSLRAGDR